MVEFFFLIYTCFQGDVFDLSIYIFFVPPLLPIKHQQMYAALMSARSVFILERYKSPV